MEGWITTHKEDLPDEDFEKIYDLYVRTYTAAKEDLWFKSAQQLRDYRYPCVIAFYVKDNDILAFLMFQMLSVANKISLFGHDGSNEGKTLVLDKLASLLVTPGYVIESSGAVSWILRSRYRLMPILDLLVIEEVLEIKKRGDVINLIPNYDVNNKGAYVYIKYSGGYEMRESLFGLPCLGEDLEWSEEGCGRLCMTNEEVEFN